MRLRSIGAVLAVLVTGVTVGAVTQHIATADISSGDRPVLVSIEPCRLADTRGAPNTVGPRAAPLFAADTHTIDAQEPGTGCTDVIPGDASALSLNVTALNATELSFLTIWAGGDRPLAASLNPAPGAPPVPNAVTTELSVDQTFEVYNEAGQVDIVVDVNGYYSNHDHDDRYVRIEDLAHSTTYTRSGTEVRNFGIGPGADTIVGAAPVAISTSAATSKSAVAIATVHNSTTGDQASTWSLDVERDGVSQELATQTMTVVPNVASAMSPADSITIMSTVDLPPGATSTFSVSGVRGDGVPLATVTIDLTVIVTPLPPA